jgi:uncharacterized protein YndB with AHSA1/START domain
MTTKMTTNHATFTLEREYPVPPAAVFARWAEPAAKARWFAGGDAEHELDFRVGGVEIAQGARDGAVLTFESRYHDIVEDSRIVYASTLRTDDTLATVSLTTVEFVPVEGGTRLVLTEQGAFLDGHEQPSWREQGTSDQLAALGADLAGTAAR